MIRIICKSDMRHSSPTLALVVLPCLPPAVSKMQILILKTLVLITYSSTKHTNSGTSLSPTARHRIFLHVEGTPVAFRVIKAREIQTKRYEDIEGMYCNAQMGSKQLREICVINQAGENLLKRAMEKLNLSARAYDRILKVSRTVADLAGSADIKVEPLAEAIQYRSLDREGWAG